MSTEIIALTVSIVVAMSVGFLVAFSYYKRRKDEEVQYVF